MLWSCGSGSSNSFNDDGRSVANLALSTSLYLLVIMLLMFVLVSFIGTMALTVADITLILLNCAQIYRELPMQYVLCLNYFN
ncbi:MAG TPA: DUF4870 domain-containing protein [Gammaproteobacteria bacterium]|nr:DUF4870 domain-containing protein [Gammaproteobacteria bacterium]